ncbi:hypothetical protein N7462_000785 [Penicillium macrosclerotiorum]|uniref:uncharacterized protein n=1 Tax=Penicillium macrosclerotiorum TaxID=303699 RepID=UPI002547E81C|nr:uncharacterized protein N7462_000785 [Penicillium macrosclerotiorum]KAJ5698780.1 hypothetical protein N7462_000785 [Penicillium macrosclerotiorum]
MSCPVGSDDVFGPRVLSECRSFDFTLLFEDAIFSLLPAALFLVLALCRLSVLIRAPIKVTSHRLATWKLISLAILLALHILYLAFQLQTSLLHTKTSLAASLLSLIAITAACILSWLEDQRTVRPSDIMVIYFFVTTLLALPRARTLWLLSPIVKNQAILWTLLNIGTATVLCLESLHKTKVLRFAYRSSKEGTSSFWVRSFFIWVLPLFRSGFTTILRVHNMPELDHNLQGVSAEQRLIKAWPRTKNARRHRLLQVTFLAYLWSFASAILPRLCLTAFKFCQPFLISATLDFISASSNPDSRYQGPALVGAFVLTYLGMAVSTAVYWRQSFRFNTTVRAGLISLLYRQTNKLPAAEFKSKQSITLMGTDVERIITKFRFIHEAWAAPVDVAIGVFLLARQLGVTCLVPAVISILAVLATIPVSSKSNLAQKLWIERVQARLSTTSSMLHDMKSVKMLGLGDKLYACLSQLRKIELQVSEKFRILLIWQVALSNVPVTFAPFATFAIFAIAQSLHGGESLLSNRMFTSLSLISLMTDPLLIFIQTLPALWESLSCFDRIERYCTQAPIDFPQKPLLAEREVELTENHVSMPEFSGAILEFNNASFSWSQEAPALLHDLSLSIKRGEISVFIGSIGSGKTTLLESSLGETVLMAGSMSRFSTDVAYCPQAPWITNDTLRQNIIGPAPYDSKWYNFVIWACSLDADFDNILGGDLSKAGSGGITLSGGQKQRISLARAVYSRAPTLILDDVFSGLDTKSVSAISTRLLAPNGHFRESGRTVILATHNHRLLPYADNVVLLENGRISKSGSYDEIRGSLPHDNHSQDSADSSIQEAIGSQKDKVETSLNRFTSNADDENAELNPSRRDGNWSVYRYYFRSAGLVVMLILVFLVLVCGFADRFSTVWLQQWSDANEQNPNQDIGMYIGVYALLFTVSLIGLLVGCWLLFVILITNTGRTMHSDLLKSTLSAPFSFSQKVDAGLILNRFSQDLELIDMNLPAFLMNTMISFANCCVLLVILCVEGKYLSITIPALAVTLFFVQSYYLRTSRQVRLLDIEAKSPLFTHFVETMQGISVIRALRWQVPFQNRLQELLNQSQKPFYMLYCIQQWLQLVLDCIVMALAVILASLVISLKDKFSPGAIGVALNLILNFNQDLMQLIRSWTILETSIGAVARVQDFTSTTPAEDQDRGELATVSSKWPEQGELEFRSVVAAYSPESPPILKNLSLVISPGQKIAVCGPSGSGKTSLILGLLQMIELQGGQIILDGVDLSSVASTMVRSRVNVVPQEPFFMPGTLRFNLDRDLEQKPVSDETLIHALETVGLWKKVCDNGHRGEELDQPLAISNWSAGERQLLSLARALIMKSSILVLDEATSSVDWETENTMQTIIEQEFASQTVVSVIHRLRYIERYDRVALLKQGRLVEYDSPRELLSRPSEFQSFYRTKQVE